MGTRSVRLDDEAEDVLSEIVKRTGLSISDAIKQGLIAFRDKSQSDSTNKPSNFFKNYDFGDDDCSLGPARQSKTILREKLKSRSEHDIN